MKAQITFRSGAQIEADLEEFTFTKGVVSGDLRQMQWVTPDDGTRKLQYLDHSEVVAVVTFHEPSGEDATAPPDVTAARWPEIGHMCPHGKPDPDYRCCPPQALPPLASGGWVKGPQEYPVQISDPEDPKS